MSFLFVEGIGDFTLGKSIQGFKKITADTPFLYPDEEGRFIFPSSLIGETLGQLTAWNVMKANHFSLRPVAGVVSAAHLKKHAYLGDTLHLEAEIEQLDEAAVLYHSKASVNGEEIVRVEGALGPLLPMETFIESTVVQQQFEALLAPNDCLKNKETTTPVSTDYSKLIAYDKITDVLPQQSLVAEKKIDPKAPYFADHFPRKPVLPMTLLLESKLQLARYFLTTLPFISKFSFVALRKIKMNGFVHPNDQIFSYLTLKEKAAHQLVLAFKTEVNAKRVCVAEVVISYE